MMKILLTGGAGYIGSHTCVELLNSGYDVVVDACLTCHLVGKRNALALRGDHHVVLRSDFQKISGARRGELHVAKHNKSTDGQLVVQGTQRELSFKARNLQGIKFIHWDLPPRLIIHFIIVK